LVILLPSKSSLNRTALKVAVAAVATGTVGGVILTGVASLMEKGNDSSLRRPASSSLVDPIKGVKGGGRGADVIVRSAVD